MFLCINCGNNIKSTIQQLHTQSKKSRTTGCVRWMYYIKCDCCKKSNDYKNFIKHKILFTPIIFTIINNL